MKCVCTKDICNPATGCANLSKTTTQEIATSVSTPEIWKADLRSSSISALYSDILKVTKHNPKSVERGVRAQAGAMLVSIIIFGALSLIIILLYMCVSLKTFLNRRHSDPRSEE
ncbi:uncharacterized protein LOC134268206 [Saccostrea cucullata]|uniref:uncharacterized protein LOC134268206 n=1 Tax=Saccostrea cuccullata TaxID=36930 RepID=UPI002ED41282